MDLAKSYPPAKSAFVSLRDRMESRCRENQGDFESFHDVVAMNRCLKDELQSANLFLEIVERFPDNARRIYHVAEQALISEGMYEACSPYLDWEPRLSTSISAFRLLHEREESREESRRSPPKVARRMFQQRSQNLVAILSVNGKYREADEVCRRCLAVIDDKEMIEALESGKTGHFPER